MKSDQPKLGTLLRRLRTHKEWTLKQMSERTGIPVSTLSKVEHDHLTLTYDKLQQLSQRLSIRMSELLAEGETVSDAAVTARRSVGRVEGAIRVNTTNCDYYYLCPELRRKRMTPVLTRIRERSVAELVRHSGENTSTSSKAGWRSTLSSTIPSFSRPANRCISKRPWATRTSLQKAAPKQRCWTYAAPTTS